MESRYFDREPGQHFIGDVRYPNFDLEGYFDDLKIEYKTHDSDGHIEYAINCPECVNRGEERPDTRYRLWINTDTARYYCFNCQWGGLLAWLVKNLSNTSYEEAVRMLMGKKLDPLDHMNLRLYEEQIEAEEAEWTLKELDFPYGYEPISGPHPYLEERGIPWNHAVERDWGIGTIGFCQNRLIVPTYMNNRLVFWQARSTWDEPGNKEFKKVLNPQGVSSKGILYGYDQAIGEKQIVICEGFIDAAKVGEKTIATNGKRIHPAQVEFLVEAQVESVVLFWDLDSWKDSRGKRESSIKRASDALKSFFKVKAVLPPDTRDPGDYPWRSQDLQDLILKAKEIS